jgi:SAM-dependent methyltransferase
MNVSWVDRICPLCSSSDQSRVIAESNIDLGKLNSFAFASRKNPEYMHPRLVECPTCRLLYGSPVLTPESLADAYHEADFDSGKEAGYASQTYSAEIRKIIPRLPELNGALDIGTGDGVFLERLLELGFRNVAGVEPSVAPCEAAKPAIRPMIRLGLFHPADFEPGKLSLATCFQTMEHVPDPLGIASGVRSLLRRGGAFVIVVHNREALSAKVLGFKSPIFDIEHLQLFSPETARALLERAGYRDVHVAPLYNRYPLNYWMKLLPFPGSVKNGILSVVGASGLGKMIISLPAGNLVCVGYAP